MQAAFIYKVKILQNLLPELVAQVITVFFYRCDLRRRLYVVQEVG